MAPRSAELVGTWVARGTVLGQIIDPAAFRFSAVVSQEEASNLFEDRIRKAEVRLYGQAAEDVAVSEVRIIPFQQEQLPSAALGWRAGGQVAVSPTDQKGVQAAEPFFQIQARVLPADGVAFFHGKSGKLRFTLEPEALLVQWGRTLRQLLQKRYRI